MHTPNFFDLGSVLLFLAGAINFGYSLVELKKTRRFCKTVFNWEEEISEKKIEFEHEKRRDAYNLALKRFKQRILSVASQRAPEQDKNMAEIQFSCGELVHWFDEEHVDEGERVKDVTP